MTPPVLLAPHDLTVLEETAAIEAKGKESVITQQAATA